MRLACFVLLFGLVAGASQPAHAHARIVRSEPARGTAVADSPRQLDLWFNELLENGFNFVTVFPEGELGAKKRSNLVSGKPAVDPRDRTRLTVKLGPLAPGEYVVEWRVLSRDGHTAPGRFTFRVR